MSTIPERLSAIETTQTSHGEILDRIDKTLNLGNGQPPMITRLDRIERTQKSCMDAQSASKSTVATWVNRVWHLGVAITLAYMALK